MVTKEMKGGEEDGTAEAKKAVGGGEGEGREMMAGGEGREGRRCAARSADRRRALMPIGSFPSL